MREREHVDICLCVCVCARERESVYGFACVAAGERACGRLGEGLAGTQAEEAVDMHVRTTDRESRSRKSKTESFFMNKVREREMGMNSTKK